MNFVLAHSDVRLYNGHMTTTNKGIKMVAKFPGRCFCCDGEIAVGADIAYYRGNARGRTVAHVDCARMKALRIKIQNAGFLALAHGGRDELYYDKVRLEMEAELAALEAKVAA